MTDRSWHGVNSFNDGRRDSCWCVRACVHAPACVRACVSLALLIMCQGHGLMRRVFQALRADGDQSHSMKKCYRRKICVFNP